MANYLDPKNDLTFKYVFGEHKHLCMSLINSILPLKTPVVSIEYRTGELIPPLMDILRNTIVDVRCIDETGNQFLVEMQLYWYDVFRQRVLLNASKAYINQLNKAQEIKLIKPVYALSFVNEIFEKSELLQNEYFHHYQIVNIKDTDRQIKGLEFFFLELPKYKLLNNFSEAIEATIPSTEKQDDEEVDMRELWLRFLTEIDENTEAAPKKLLENEYTREALSYVERGAYTKEQLEQYEQRKIDTMTSQAIIKEAEEKAEERARKEMEGVIAQKDKDLAQATQDLARKDINTVLNAKKEGLSIETIAAITGLTTQQVLNIINPNTETK